MLRTAVQETGYLEQLPAFSTKEKNYVTSCLKCFATEKFSLCQGTRYILEQFTQFLKLRHGVN
jgi:hypothetical protein